MSLSINKNFSNINISTLNGVNTTQIFNQLFSSFNNQQGDKLVGTGNIGESNQGITISLSADGNTLAIGGSGDDTSIGATWVFTRNPLTQIWSQQGDKLVGNGNIGGSSQGFSVAISGDGNTIAIGGNTDNSSTGAVWIFTRTLNVWSQYGNKLVANNHIGASQQGSSVSLNYNGTVLAIGGYADNSNIGATWIYNLINGVWIQIVKLIGSGYIGSSYQGSSVYLSSDGKTLAVGGYGDNGGIGATWIFSNQTGSWFQVGNKLVGLGYIGSSVQGGSVALSSDGLILAVGGTGDSNNIGATWIFKKSINGNWYQFGNKLIGSNGVPTDGNLYQGNYVSLNYDGSILVVGSVNDNNNIGAFYVFKYFNGINVTEGYYQQNSKIIGSDSIGQSLQGSSVCINSLGDTIAIGGNGDNTAIGATWIFK